MQVTQLIVTDFRNYEFANKSNVNVLHCIPTPVHYSINKPFI